MSQPARVVPCLLLDGDRMVKTVGFRDPDYVGDPVNVLSLFNSFEVDEIMLLDIRGAGTRSLTDPATLRHFAEECFIPLAYGGGLTGLDQIEAVFSAGYEKVVMNTALVEQPELVSAGAAHFGSQAIVAAIDVAGASPAEWRVQVRGGTVDTGLHPVEQARAAEQLGAGEILLTSIEREGTMAGFDLDLVEAVSHEVGVPVVAHGGAGRRKDLVEPIRRGASAVAAGSLFVYQGSNRGVLINYPSRARLLRLMDV